MIHLFNRFELKYILDINTAQEIIEELSRYTHPDPHGGAEGYRVTSLYYDSPDLDFFWDKIEGLKYRRKVRIRIYPGTDIEAVSEAMVEIKQRINRTVQKRRLKLPLEEAYTLCRGEYQWNHLSPLEQAVASEINYLTAAKNLQPTCIIDYHRKAFMGTQYNPGLRITFDTDLRCRTQNLGINQDLENHHFLPLNCCIMEIKVDETVPNWVSALLTRFNCELHRVSKYCAGVALDHHIAVMPLAVTPIPNLTLMESKEPLYESTLQ